MTAIVSTDLLPLLGRLGQVLDQESSLVRSGDFAGSVALESEKNTLIAEYVEEMQIRVGLDTDADGTVDALRRADQVSDWSQAMSTEVGVLVRSPFADDEYSDNVDGRKDVFNDNKRGSYTIGGKTIVKSDHYRREAFSTVVFMRNDNSDITL